MCRLAPGEAREDLEHRGDLRASGVSPLISSAAAMAPALTIGLNGRLWTSSRTIELKASPVGSTPTCGEHGLAAVISSKRMAVDEGLRDRLDGEERVGVAGGVDLAVDGRDGDAEGPDRPWRARECRWRWRRRCSPACGRTGRRDSGRSDRPRRSRCRSSHPLSMRRSAANKICAGLYRGGRPQFPPETKAAARSARQPRSAC